MILNLKNNIIIKYVYNLFFNFLYMNNIKKILLSLLIVVLISWGIYAANNITSLTQSVSEWDIITSEYYNNLNWPKSEWKMCKYSWWKLVCLDDATTTPIAINWICDNSTSWWCSAWTVSWINNTTTCWTTATWTCKWSNWWSNSTQCSYKNTDCSSSLIYSWVTWTYWACSATCGWWTQTRTVECKGDNWVTVSDSNCPSPKPATSQSCNTQACPVSYYKECKVLNKTATRDYIRNNLDKLDSMCVTNFWSWFEWMKFSKAMHCYDKDNKMTMCTSSDSFINKSIVPWNTLKNSWAPYMMQDFSIDKNIITYRAWSNWWTVWWIWRGYYWSNKSNTWPYWDYETTAGNNIDNIRLFWKDGSENQFVKSYHNPNDWWEAWAVLCCIE